MANTAIYKEDWTVTMQDSLDGQTFWKDVCRVDYSSKRTLHNPYQNDETVAALTRGSVFTLNDITLTDDSVTIDSDFIASSQIDRADLGQIGYDLQMERAERMGVAINERVEQTFVGDYANMTKLDNTLLGGAAGDITLTNTNVDEVMTGIKRTITAANGQKLAARNGRFIIWDPVTFEKLEQFAMANGYVTQDSALRGGVDGMTGFSYGGFTHYASNFLTTETSTLHVIAGVKKLYHVGIYSPEYGVVRVTDGEGGLRSSIIITSRLTHKGKVWNNVAPVLYNVEIAG